MPVLESLKKVAEKATGFARPSRHQIEGLVRIRKANAVRFKDDAVIPNNARWPLVVYRGAVSLPADLDPAAIIEDLFDENGRGDSWRNEIYDYVHYHSRIHEVLGIAKGNGAVRFGGNNGKTIQLKAGDVAILAAGTGHQCLAAGADFLVVGAYPPSGTYDECTKSQEHAAALKTIPKVGRPRKDPVYGSRGPLLSAWKPRSMTSQSETDPHELQRFVEAQSAVYPQVIEELFASRKRSHWMWFVFPQIVGLGFSAMAQRYAIRSKAEAKAYLAHDVLGARLMECTRLVMAASEKTITAILGSPDDVKFRSSMTLFDAVSKHEIFAEAIGTFYSDGKDSATLRILGSIKD